MRKAYFSGDEKKNKKRWLVLSLFHGSTIDNIGEWHFVCSLLFAPSAIAWEQAPLYRFGKVGEKNRAGKSPRALTALLLKFSPNSHE